MIGENLLSPVAIDTVETILGESYVKELNWN